MKKVFLSILAFSCIAIGNAQTNTEKDPEAYRVKKNELSVGMFNAFSLNSGPSPTITYKRYSEGGAFRVSVGGMYQFNDRSGAQSPFNSDELIQDKYEFTSGNIGIGYEWHLPMNRWMLYYGIDARGFYSTSKDVLEIKYDYGNNSFETRKDETIDETIGIGAETFLGMKFWINERISLNSEFSALIRYNMRTSNTNNSNVYDNQSVITTTENKSSQESSNIGANLSPLGLISFNFHF